MELKKEQQAEGRVLLSLAFRKEGRWWLGKCIELGTSTFGRTLAEVDVELVELVNLHLRALKEVGERERFFRTHGIRLYSGGAAPDPTGPSLTTDDLPYCRSHYFGLGDSG
jgi:hypothetical protein